jgi:hypothetical protein
MAAFPPPRKKEWLSPPSVLTRMALEEAGR